MTTTDIATDINRVAKSTTLIELTLLHPGTPTTNARRTPAPIDGLATSIIEHGLLMPLIVRKNLGNDYYTVIAGNRRLAALLSLAKNKIANITLHTLVPALVAEGGNAAMLELSLVENIDRANLHPVDKFEVFAELVANGHTVDDIARKRGMKINEVRQALALGRMAPEVREAWRTGKISAETAEAFTVTGDHAAQARVLKKQGKNAWPHSVRRELTVGVSDRVTVDAMMKLVGRDAYEKAGHHVNPLLFHDGDRKEETVSDIGALTEMYRAKIDGHCETLKGEGWSWAMSAEDTPRDFHAWKRVDKPKYTKEEMASLGCVVGIDYSGKLEVRRGIAKPGVKISVPKSNKEKKDAAKKRAERKEETGGITNSLAFRLSQQLTAAVREALPEAIGNHDAIALATAALACANDAMTMTVGRQDGDSKRFENDFGKYLKLAQSQRTDRDRAKLLMTWLAPAIDLICHDGGHLNGVLHPDKNSDGSTLAIVKMLHPGDFAKAIRKHFDAKDYFESASKELIVEAVTEAMGKEHGTKVAKMKTAEAKKFAIANVKGWVPPALRIGSHKDMPK